MCSKRSSEELTIVPQRAFHATRLDFRHFLSSQQYILLPPRGELKMPLEKQFVVTNGSSSR